MKTLKNGSLYFVTGKGYVAPSQKDATKFSAEEVANVQECIASCGLPAGTVEDVKVEADPNVQQNSDGSSYAVGFVRPGQMRSDLSINTHRLNPSKRRFKTEDEAVHHGLRFMKIEKHTGFFVIKTTDPVNAYVNKVTGKTNPVIGRARTNR